MLKHLQQDELNNCGQTCVAIVAGKQIAEATVAVGKRGKTDGPHLIRGLRSLRIKCSDKAKRSVKHFEYPRFAIIRVRAPKVNHWVVIHDWMIYDPAQPEPVTPTRYFTERPRTKVTAYIEILD